MAKLRGAIPSFSNVLAKAQVNLLFSHVIIGDKINMNMKIKGKKVKRGMLLVGYQ